MVKARGKGDTETLVRNIRIFIFAKIIHKRQSMFVRWRKEKLRVMSS